MRIHMTRESAAQKHAVSERTDPFAYARAMLHMKNGIDNAYHLTQDSDRRIKHAPVNGVIIAAYIKAVNLKEGF